MNEAEHETVGIYLVESETSVQAYLDVPIMIAAKDCPVVSNINAMFFDVIESHTAITHGPLKQALDIAL